MKVVLALNSQQAEKLQQLIAIQNEDAANWGSEDTVACGDILMFDHGFSFNTNQSIRVDGLRVELDGQRCALASDGIFEILGRSLSQEVDDLFTGAEKLPYDERSSARYAAWQLAKREFSKVYVVSYETTDSRLKWWERLEDIAPTLTVRELNTMSAEQLGQNSLNGNKTLGRIRDLLIKHAREGYAFARVSAELDKDELFIFNKMKDHLINTYGYKF